MSFLGLFFGVVDNSSVDSRQKAALCVGDVVQARITLMDYANKVARLSLHRHVLEMRTPSDLPKLGKFMC